MPKVDPVSIVSDGIGGVFNYAGAKKQADAAKHAADVQAKSAQEALDYTKGVQARQETAFAPYGAAGSQAASTLPGMVRQAPMSGPPTPYTTQPRATAGTPLMGMGQPPPQMPQPQQASSAMVLLQAPDGSQKQVPGDQAQFYLSKGAKRIG